MDQILQNESKHLQFVIKEIVAKIKLLLAEQDKTHQDSKKLMDHFFDDFSVNMSNYAEQLETAASIHQQQQLLQEKENSYQQSVRQLETLKRSVQKPYFGRIDFAEDKHPVEKIYIGMASFIDRDDKYLVYDWRAPISSIYYDGRLGKVSYATPDGEQEVDLKLKRQFLIDDQKLTAYFDTSDETIGDQMLLEALNEKSSSQMKTIVTTIQKEQNSIIRDTTADVLFVQGAAGSGKTSAVMQRMAFLLYRYRGNLNSTQIIMFSPNQLFNDYISNVLPEMGENNMIRFTLKTFIGRRLPNFKIIDTLDDPTDFFGAANRKIIHFIGSTDFFNLIEDYTDRLNKKGVIFRPIKFKGKEIISVDKFNQIFYQFNENYKLINRLEETKQKVLNIVKSVFGRQKKSDWVSDLVENLSEEEIRQINPRNKKFASSDEEYDFYASKILDRELRGLTRKIKRNYFLNVIAQYRDMLKHIGKSPLLKSKYQITDKEWSDYLAKVFLGLKEKVMTVHEAVSFVQLYDRLTGNHGEREIRYIFIDEIQDYTPYQIKYLRYAFPKARFTLLGDLNQEIFSIGEGRFLIDSIRKIFFDKKQRVVYLSTSYRSTKQITDFTKEVLVYGQKIQSFNRDGKLPVLYLTNSKGSALAKTTDLIGKEAKENYTTAIITKTLADAKAVSDYLDKKNKDHLLIRSAQQHLSSKVLVVPSFLAKGLEFDAVIAFDISQSNFHEELERNLLYTICSRAMHELSLISIKEESPLLARIPDTRYHKEIVDE